MLMILNMYIASFYAISLSNITKVKCFLLTKEIYIQIKSNYRCFIKNKAIGSCVNRHLCSNKMQSGNLWVYDSDDVSSTGKKKISFMYKIYLLTRKHPSLIPNGIFLPLFFRR